MELLHGRGVTQARLKFGKIQLPEQFRGHRAALVEITAAHPRFLVAVVVVTALVLILAGKGF
jgi:hypothetical protein